MIADTINLARDAAYDALMVLALVFFVLALWLGSK